MNCTGENIETAAGLGGEDEKGNFFDREKEPAKVTIPQPSLVQGCQSSELHDLKKRFLHLYRQERLVINSKKFPNKNRAFGQKEIQNASQC